MSWGLTTAKTTKNSGHLFHTNILHKEHKTLIFYHLYKFVSYRFPLFINALGTKMEELTGGLAVTA